MTLAIQETQKDDAQPDGSADKSELPIQQSSASEPSLGSAGQDAEGDAELEQHSTCTSSARKRLANETSPLPRPKHKRKKRHCRDAEDDMMQSAAAAELGAMGEQMTTEVNQEFDADRSTDTATQTGSKRTLDAVVARLRLIAAETPVPWTDEEDAALMTACEGFHKTRPMTEAFKSATETKRTDKDIIQRIEYLNLNLGHGPNPECENHSSSSFQGSQKRWTSKEDEFLETLQDGYNDESRYRARMKEFGPTRTLTSLKTRLVRLSKNPRGKLYKWTLDKDNYLRSYPDLSKRGKLAKKLALTCEEAFGHARTASAIQHRLYPLTDASESAERCSTWSPSEDAWLLTVTNEKVADEGWQSVHIAFVDKFGMGRTANALRARRVHLRQAGAGAKAETSGSLDEEIEERENAV
ncbi:uncharacterized protein Triagg1_8906 [Trichoderma aggressivum f. europaeum]|uniref:Myb-like domain-containing protein n=1 Tax=Trichoderma aggressivum f. europaeum TaxID=173218 RepID=A0AAE1J367_9HYPO|nr:hypothetical protein Triagg1_8906 [Trichoderma aggressivum f. europaeum]